jgi:hypothetical protein
MMKWLASQRRMKLNLRICAGFWLVSAGTFLFGIGSAHGQSNAGSAPARPRPIKERVLPSGYPQKPSVPPSWTIPVEPLGFSAPGQLYLGQRNSLVSLDFIDEDRLLFTFRVPGLIHRQLKTGDSAEDDERQIRAVVLTLPAGTVEAESLWTVHDRARYLWMLKDGHFLLRDGDSVQQGDAHLELKPLLRFPGSLVWLELDPSGQFLVSNSLEPAAAPSQAGDVGSPSTAAADVTTDDQNPYSNSGSDAAEDVPEMVVRVLRRESGQVMLVSRVRATIHLPINSDGYLESLRGSGEQWVLHLNYFTGGSRVLGHVDSTCAPSTDFISQQEVLVTACNANGARKLVAMTTEGKILWDDLNPITAIWPLLARSPDGLRLTQETLAVTHPVSAYEPLSTDDIKGQVVSVFNAATGEMAFWSPASPVLDAGGNAAVSPSGRRVAVLNDGSIQVFELPAAPPLPDAAAGQPGH